MSDHDAGGGLRLDVDVRLKAKGLTITRGQLITVLGALATAIWAAIRFH